VKSFLALSVALVAGYMLLDGIRALVVGDYIRPTTGEYAGQLGPWAAIVRLVGIEPTSPGMKWAFVLYGGIWLILLGAFLTGIPWAGPALLVAAFGALWYAPAGTLFGVIQIVLLVFLLRGGRAT
jgi:hypothetical protein